MSDQPSSRIPFTQLFNPSIPHLSQDSEGNVFYRETDGRWRPHNGPLPPSLLGQAQDPAVHPSSYVSLHDRNHGGPDSPIEHAFQDQYQFALRPISNPQYGIPGNSVIDPDGPTIAKLRGLKPAEKVVGSRRKGKGRADPKGKKRQRGSSGSEDDSEPVAKRGRPQGSGNYTREDTNKLFELVESELPIGQKGWKVVHRLFNKWAVQNARAKRSPKSLENKYKSYLKLKKPTESATCPPEVKRAHELEHLINSHVGARDISDSECNDESHSESSNDDIEVIEHPSSSLRTAIARRAASPPLQRKSRASGADLVNKLATAFDPESQKAREDARSHRAFETTQFLTLSQQLRDTQGLLESLRSQNSILQNHIHDLERARDRAELKLELLDLTTGADSSRGRPSRPSRLPGYRSHKREAGIERVRGKVRCEERYPDGGAQTYWVSDPSTDEYYDNDNENENESPWNTFDSRPRSRSHHTASHRAVSRRRTPAPGPSRIRNDSPVRRTTTSDRGVHSAVTGNAVELVVTPHRGPPVAFVISPPAQKNGGN
ncbi:hypothetical protein C8R44DRAFT_892032 [Mycena epipterygia]|nr:hypothetical protein C8R44DRAFT_892032 [Mycena epipterygia]